MTIAPARPADAGEAPAAPPRRIHELGWALAAQGASSIGNFVVAAVAAHLLDPEGFGAFSVATAVYFVLLGVVRAAIGEQRAMDHRSGAALDRAVLGAALVVGVATGGLVAALAGAVGGPVGLPLVAVGLGLPGLLVQDAYRFVFMARGRARAAFLVDLAWLAALGGVGVAVAAVGRPGVGVLTGLWAAGALAGVVVGAVSSGAVPSIADGVAWLVEHRGPARRLAVESLAVVGAWQLTLAVVGAGSGLVAVGSLRGAQVLFGPLHVALLGLAMVLVPDGARAIGRGVDAVAAARSRARWAAGGLTAVAGVGLALVWAMPDGWGSALVGASWDGARPVVVPFGLFMITQGLVTASVIGHRIARATAESLGAAVVSGVVLVVAGGLGSVAGGPVTIAWCLVVGGAAGAAVWWSSLARLRPPMMGGSAPVGSPRPPEDP